MLTSELRRAFSGWGFWAALCLGCSISILHIFQFVIPDYREAMEFPSVFPPTVFSRWLGGWSYPVHPVLFYFMMPIFAALPFGWSLFSDLKNSYCVQKASRKSWASYLGAKFISAFLSGGVAVSIPLIVNFFGTACVLPMIQPDPVGIGTFMIFPYSFASELFFSNAGLYCLMYLGIVFLAAGTIACLALVVGCFMPNGALATLSPFIICTVAAQTLKSTDWYSLVPTLFCMPGQDYGSLVPEMVIGYFVCVSVVYVAFIFFVARSDYLG